MSNLLINIRATPTYEDQDIIQAIPDDMIHDCHAKMLCHVKLETRNSSGLNGIDSLADLYLAKTSELKYERISKTEIKRIVLFDLSETILGPTPNADGRHMFVPIFINNRRKHARHAIFGTTGKEYWYGGGKVYSNMSSLWTEIESRTGKLKADHSKWGFSIKNHKQYLIIPGTAMTIAEASERTAPLMDSEVESHDQVVVKKRKYKIDWRSIRGVSGGTVTKILNAKIPMDFRKFEEYDWKVDSVEKS